MTTIRELDIPACKICAFWSHAEECRRYPPTVILVPSNDGAGLIVNKLERKFPVTNPNDWCGEYKP